MRFHVNNMLATLTGLIMGYFLSMMVQRSRTQRRTAELLAPYTTSSLDNFVINDDMKPAEVERLMHGYMAQIQVQCSNFFRAGNQLDGGWDVCLLDGVAPSDSCVVYSFGISNDWSFDDAMDNHFRCQVRSYDPYIETSNHSRSANIKFFNIGLGDKNQDGREPFRTFKTLLKDQHFHNVDIDYLKFDIEGSEYHVIKNMYHDGSLAKVKQLGLEVHFTAGDPKAGQKNLINFGSLRKSWVYEVADSPQPVHP